MKNTNRYNEENKIILQGGAGGGGNAGSGDNPGGPPCCDEVPTPPGPPDTYWLWPPYVKNISPNGYEGRWFQRDFLSENLLIEPGTIQYTLLYFEELTDEHGGAVSSVWGKRANFLIAPGNGFFDNLIIIGDPQGWKASQFNYPRPVPQPDGSQLTPFMLKGSIQLKNLCKIKKAGGYIFEVMKYINSNNLAGDGSTKLLGDYASIFSGSEFTTQATSPNSNTPINMSSGYDFQVTSTTPQFSNTPPESEGMKIIKDYIVKLSTVTGDQGFVNSWNSLNCTNNLTAPAKSSSAGLNWDFDEVLEALKDPWLGWGIDGRPDDQLLAGFGGDPGGNFNIMDPSRPRNSMKDAIVAAYHFITARTYYIDICGASKAYAKWKQSTNPNYDFDPEVQDYPSIRNAIKLDILKSEYNNPQFRQYLISNNLLTKFIKPYRFAVDDAFTSFVGWFTRYGRGLPVKVWNGNKELGLNETAKIDSLLCHRISWESAGLEESNNLSTVMAAQFGNDLIVGPNSIDDEGSTSDTDPVCLEYCIYTYSSQYTCSTQTWSPVIRSGPVRGPKPKPDEVNDWIIGTNGDATYKVYTIPNYNTNQCPPDVPTPSYDLSLMPANYCSCVKTWNATYSCDSLSWSIGNAKQTFERNPSNLDVWEFGQQLAMVSPANETTTSGPNPGCTAKIRKASSPCVGPTPQDKFVVDTAICCSSITNPQDPPFPTKCCARDTIGLSADIGTSGCCGVCPSWDQTGTPGATECSCGASQIGISYVGIVAPIGTPILGGAVSTADNTVSINADTGFMLDRLSVKVNNIEKGGVTSSTQIVNVDPGATEITFFFELCSQQTGSWVIPITGQGTDYDYAASWNLLEYVQSPPLTGGDNTLPPDTPVDVVL